MFKKNKDVLTAKKATLSALTAASDNAVSLVTNTIESLQLVNTKIESHRKEISDYRSELDKTDESLGMQFTTNNKVIGKFRSFIED